MGSAEDAAGHVYALGFHADYGCRNSGACCSSGWEIPVAPPAEAGIRAALGTGALRAEASRGVPLFRSRRGLPDGARVVFGLDAHGRCAFFEPETRLCAVHRQLGAVALPSSCRQFPRIALLTPVGTFLTLSPYCPTAAGMLFRLDDVPAIVADPPAFPADDPWEGLDARAWPPLLRRDAMLGWDGFVLWQEQAVRLLLRDELEPEAAVAALRLRARRACEWTAAKGPLLEWLEGIPNDSEPYDAFDFAAAAGSWRGVAARVPESLRSAAPPLGPGEEPAPVWREAHADLVAPHWARFAEPVRRYLAAKVFASWAALQGDGLAAWCLAVETALSVLRVEATRQCLEALRPLEAELLRQAFRRSDLLLHHLAR